MFSAVAKKLHMVGKKNLCVGPDNLKYTRPGDKYVGIAIGIMEKIASTIRGVLGLGAARGFYIENGVYLWKGDSYVKLNISDEKELFSEPGYYLIYFHNNLCPSCRRFYPIFETILKNPAKELAGILHIRVVCDWFASKCGDSAAKRLFAIFNVYATPKLLLIKADRGSRYVLSDIVEELGASILREKEFSRALITLIKKNVGGIGREESG